MKHLLLVGLIYLGYMLLAVAVMAGLGIKGSWMAGFAIGTIVCLATVGTYLGVRLMVREIGDRL